MKSTKNNNWKRVHMCGHDPARPDHTYTKAEISYRKNTLEEFKRLGTGIYTMLFCTLGMFIIDDIYFPKPKAPAIGIMGGAGAYAALGARLLLKPDRAIHVGWVVHKGSDFPQAVFDEINSWGTYCHYIDTPDRLTTRAWNKYGKNDFRDFKYLTPKARVEVGDMPMRQICSKSFHLICSASRCIDLVKSILDARALLKANGGLKFCAHRQDVEIKLVDPPIFVWEPVPDMCIPSELPKVLEAMKYVDVLSPNQKELAALFGESKPDAFMACELDVLERQCNELLTKGFGKKPSAVIVRRGERGCYIASNNRHTWFPAYHRPRDEVPVKDRPKWTNKVVDPTGGGNAFLGAFCAGICCTVSDGSTNFERAAMYGSVASSFVIEQVGMPTRSVEGDHELWNGDSVRDRLVKFEQSIPLERLSQGQLDDASPFTVVSEEVWGEQDRVAVRKALDASDKRCPTG